jgi:TolB-like protein/Flp pilus assembly protein TadD
MPLTPGTRLGRYEILAALGAGGMGEVYRARDPRLERDVAIKTLPADFASHPDRLRRFEQEARAIAALSHPNLLAVFDVGHDGDTRYLVTELLEGETLRERIIAGPLDLAAVVDLGRQLTAGLGSAHARGVVHRDLKPDNIFLTHDGFAKVLDFGLAKMSRDAKGTDADATRTADGVVLGTLAYMAPEQRAGRDADVRSDVFAVGEVLFEALSGARVWARLESLDTLSALLRGREVEDVPVPPALSGPLGRVVGRCLEQDPANRFQTMHELRAALDALGETSSTALAEQAHASVAVLPFDDLSADKSQAYFCEGMAEEIINALARVDGLRVAARTSTFQVKAQGRELGQIARTLNVRTVLEGSVRTSGRRLRVTAQLADASSSRAIWSDRYDGGAEEVFDIQDRISSAIVSALKIKLLGDRPAPTASRQTSSLDAYHAYLKGRHHRLTTYDLLAACRAFTHAAELDPAYAPAHAGAAHTLVMLGHYGFIPPNDARARANAAIDRALANNPALPQALAARAYVLLLFDRRWSEAEALLLRALELDPSDVDCRVFLAYLHVVLGHADKAAEQFEQARVLEPFSAWTRAATGMGLIHLGDFQGALAEAGHALEARPDSLLAQAAYGAALTFLGRHDEGVPVLEAAAAAAPTHHWVRCWLGVGYGTAGRVADAEGIMKTLGERQLTSYVSPGWMALVPASLGRAEEALALLDMEINAGGSVPTFLRSPVIRLLRAHPAYHEMLRRLDLPPV